jgi:putative membrane protein
MPTRNTDHLANERTFLAYLRTSLSFIAFGFVVARFSLFSQEFALVTHEHQPSMHLSTAFGVVMAATGVLVALYGVRRYNGVFDAVVDERAAPMSKEAALTLGAVLALMGAVVSAALFFYK